MRRLIRTLLLGSFAFGLLSASAVGAGFTIASVGAIATSGTAEATATVTVTVELCDGTYDIAWVNNEAKLVSYTAVRTPPEGDEDPGLAFCAEQPYKLTKTDGGILDSGTTDEAGGISTVFDEQMQPTLEDDDVITLTIGPGAGL
jgi:hypothetical protein